MIIEGGDYRATPFQQRPTDAALQSTADFAWKLAYTVKRCSEHEAFFSDYMKNSDAAREAVIRTLATPGQLLWEVAHKSAQGIDLVGILRLSDIVPRCNAKAHYFFFDRRLRDKTDLLLAWRELAFAEAGLGLHRITAEVPAYAAALASHAKRYLGFTEEGRMRDAIRWRDRWHDVLVLGAVAQ